MEKEKKIKLEEIPKNSCKIFDIENARVAVCHEPTGEFSFFELKSIRPIHTYEAGTKFPNGSIMNPPSYMAGAIDKE